MCYAFALGGLPNSTEHTIPEDSRTTRQRVAVSPNLRQLAEGRGAAELARWHVRVTS